MRKMIKRLPEPVDQIVLAAEFGMLALQQSISPISSKRLMIVPAQASHQDQLSTPGYDRSSYDNLPKDEFFDEIVAIDLLSEEDDQYETLLRVKQLLNPSGKLILIQNNLMLRRGNVPPIAGGPPRTPTYYHFRTFATKVLEDINLAVGYLDSELKLCPTVKAGRQWPEGLAKPAEAVVFIAGNTPFEPRVAPSPSAEINHHTNLQEVSTDITLGALRKIAFVIDVREWAFENIVKNISPYLTERFDVSCFYICDYEDKSELIFDIFVKENFDNVHFMWRELWFNTIKSPTLLMRILEKHSLAIDNLAYLLAKPVVTTTIYDHLFSSKEKIAEREIPLALTDGYATSSKILYDIYVKASSTKPVNITKDGVDLLKFKGNSVACRDSGSLRVGWVGNSEWGKNQDGVGSDPKGLSTILMPTLNILKRDGYNVSLALADGSRRKRTRDEMVAFYHDEIDVLVCCSTHEGTPNPILEAMASAKPWISTRVGIVEQIAGPKQTEFILEERTIEAMASCLRSMIKTDRHKLAKENLKYVETNDWSFRVSQWTRLFMDAEQGHNKKTSKLRESYISHMLAQNSHFATPYSEGRNITSTKNRIKELEDWTAEMKIYIKNLEERSTVKGIIKRVINRISKIILWTPRTGRN